VKGWLVEGILYRKRSGGFSLWVEILKRKTGKEFEGTRSKENEKGE
jgi:hypothetical protein